jgi:hypothetical protein
MGVPDGVSYDVTAHTTFGRVSSEPSLQVRGTVSPESLTGKLGVGGCAMSLTGQNGNIEIVRTLGR